jgi:PleD family two-component response regulator
MDRSLRLLGAADAFRESVAVALDSDQCIVHDRAIAAARAQLGVEFEGTPPIEFAVGLSFLDVDGDAEAAVAAADAAMYEQKKRKRLSAVRSRAAGG